MIAKTLPEADKARLGKALRTASGDGQDERDYNTYIDFANRLADHFDVPRAVITDSRQEWNPERELGIEPTDRPAALEK